MAQDTLRLTVNSELLLHYCPVSKRKFSLGETVIRCRECGTVYSQAGWTEIGGFCRVCNPAPSDKPAKTDLTNINLDGVKAPPYSENRHGAGIGVALALGVLVCLVVGVGALIWNGINNQVAVMPTLPPTDVPVQANPPSSVEKPVVIQQKPTQILIPTTDFSETPTRAPEVVQSTSSCPGAPAQQLEVNEDAEVCTKVDKVALRSGPGKRYEVKKWVVPGTVVWVIGNPSCADNWSYWEVRLPSGETGWMSEGGDSRDSYFLCPN